MLQLGMVRRCRCASMRVRACSVRACVQALASRWWPSTSYAIPHRRLGNTSNAINSLQTQLFVICGIFHRVFSFYFLINWLDPTLRGREGERKKARRRPWLTTRILNCVKWPLTNELCSHTNRKG